MSDWQPIETAPKDGTPIIITGVYPNGIKWVEEGRWQNHTKRFSGPIEGPIAWQPLPSPPDSLVDQVRAGTKAVSALALEMMRPVYTSPRGLEREGK